MWSEEVWRRTFWGYPKDSPKLLLSGGIVNGYDKGHAEDMRNKAIELGVNPEDIIIENQSQNTVEKKL
ncbi:MAG: YdcF family protein [Butyrivibrio sp.]|nr:YdcF family protein [Butyrivibrio sp.]